MNQSPSSPVRAILEFNASHGSLLSQFMLREGRNFRAARSSRYQKGILRECFRNASLLAIGNPELIYVEGWSFLHYFPVEHAWCVNRRSLLAHEVTWETPGFEYFGVAFKTDFLAARLVKNGIYGIIGYGRQAEEFLALPSEAWRSPLIPQ